MKDVHPRAVGGQRVGQLAGRVGRGVVDHEQVEAGRGEALDEAGEGVGLAVGRDDNDRAAALDDGPGRRGGGGARRGRGGGGARRGGRAACEGQRRQLGDGDRDQLAGEGDQAQRESQRGGGAGADGGPERDDERALPQPDPAGRQRDEDAEQPRQGERAEEQEGIQAGGRAEGSRQRPGAEAGGDPARGVEGDHQRQGAPAQRPGGLDSPGLEAIVQPAADERRARGHGRHERGREGTMASTGGVDPGAQEAGHGGRRARDDDGELLVAGDGHDLRRGGADPLARGDAVGEADDAARLVAQQERARPHARQRAGRTAGADAPQPEREGQPLQQRRDGEERDGEREQPVVDRPVEGRDRLALRPPRPGEADDGAGGEQEAQAA